MLVASSCYATHRSTTGELHEEHKTWLFHQAVLRRTTSTMQKKQITSLGMHGTCRYGNEHGSMHECKKEGCCHPEISNWLLSGLPVKIMSCAVFILRSEFKLYT
jgi:hypothetical protein